MSSYYTTEELSRIGLKSYGEKVLISRKASIYFPANISIGNNVRIDDFAILSAKQEIVIHSHIHIGAYALMLGGGGIIMEDFSGISHYACLLSESDDFSGESLMGPTIDPLYKPGIIRGKIILKKYCAVGLRSTVFPGITIGEGSVIGAHAIVTNDTDDWYIYAGSIARRLKPRSRNMLTFEDPFREAFEKSINKSRG
jgi:galactoside O-acetyltransferase